MIDKYNIKDNSHIGCIILFIVVGLLFMVYSVPKLKKYDAQEQHRLTDTEMARVWEIVDSVKHEELMEEYNYAALYEENQELRERIKRIKECTEELEDVCFYFERKGFDVSEFQDAIDNIYSECE